MLSKTAKIILTLFFGTKKGYVNKQKIRVYKPRKERLDNIVGSLSLEQYAAFIEAIIAKEAGNQVDPKFAALIEAASKAIYDEVENNPGSGGNDSHNPDIATVMIDSPDRLHIEVQWILKQLGKMAGCQVFIARNDVSHIYKGEHLNNGCINELPKKGITDNTYKRISLIDVVWVQKRKIVCAFEVECSTSIYSGILRMSDLAYSMPYDSIKGYIIAPESRKDKVIEQLARPTFSNEHIQGFIRYMTVEELKDLYFPLADIGLKPGSINPDVLEQKSHMVDTEL